MLNLMLSGRLARGYLFWLILSVALVVVAGMTIRGGYVLSVRSKAVEILLSPVPASDTQDARPPASR
jgi:hypothetical protein